MNVVVVTVVVAGLSSEDPCGERCEGGRCTRMRFVASSAEKIVED